MILKNLEHLEELEDLEQDEVDYYNALQDAYKELSQAKEWVETCSKRWNQARLEVQNFKKNDTTTDQKNTNTD